MLQSTLRIDWSCAESASFGFLQATGVMFLAGSSQVKMVWIRLGSGNVTQHLLNQQRQEAESTFDIY